MKKVKMSRRRFVATIGRGIGDDDRRAVRARRARGRQAVDRLVGPLGARRQQGLHGRLIEEWAAKEKVEVQIDYITSQGNKNLLTIAAEAQAKVRPRHLAMPTWWPHDQALNLEPVDDIMEPSDQAERRRERHRRISRPRTEAVGWRCRRRRQPDQGPCSRIDLMKKHAGIDVQAHVSGRRRRRRPTAGRWTPS